jgi:hypothetical protein
MATPVQPHAVPPGPLAVRWLEYDLPSVRAGSRLAADVVLENAGSAAWKAQIGQGIHISYHWLDPLGNPIVWAGLFTPLPSGVAPGGRLQLTVPIEAPMPPGRYRLALDLVDEGRCWFAELGNEPLELEVEVLPRLARRALAAQMEEGPPELLEATRAALAAQKEPLVEEGEATAFLVPGACPAPDWSRRILDAHEEGYAAVGGSIELEGGLLERRRAGAALQPWKPGFGRMPAWTRPLLCPSLLNELVPEARWDEPLEGLPALDTSDVEDRWICDGRIRISVPVRALPRAGRRRA